MAIIIENFRINLTTLPLISHYCNKRQKFVFKICQPKNNKLKKILNNLRSNHGFIIKSNLVNSLQVLSKALIYPHLSGETIAKVLIKFPLETRVM